MELKGSKTEKNLMEAFAGESQARNKYKQYSKKQLTMKKNMQKCGSNYYKEETSKQQQKT